MKRGIFKRRTTYRMIAGMLVVTMSLLIWGCGGSNSVTLGPPGVQAGVEGEVNQPLADGQNPTPGVRAAAKKPIASSAFSFLMSAVGGGIMGYGISAGMGWAMSLCGFGPELEGPDMTGLQILAKLDEMDAKLDIMNQKLDIIYDQFGEVMGAIGMAKDEMMAQIETLQLKEAVDTIELNYGYLKYFGSDSYDDPYTKGRATRFADDILSSRACEIPYHLYSIHTTLIGSTPGVTEGALGAWTTYLMSNVAENDLMGAYLALEYNFAQILNIEAQGLALTVEALHCRETEYLLSTKSKSAGPVRPEDFPGTAKQFLDTEFTPRIDDQVAAFLMCVERLVMSHADVRTDIIAPVDFLPTEDVAEIFRRADFLAAQCSSRHNFGLNVRLIGEPANIQRYVDEQLVLANGRRMNYPAPIAGQNVRQHPVQNWPDYYPTPEYMQWQLTASAIASRNFVSASGIAANARKRLHTCTVQTPCDPSAVEFTSFVPTGDIAVAKLELPNAEKKARTFVVTAPSGAPQVVQVQRYNSDFSVATTNRAECPCYGSVTVEVRNAPATGWVVRANSIESAEPEGCWSPTSTSLVDVTAQPPFMRQRAEVSQRFPDGRSSGRIEFTAAMAYSCINGSDRNCTIGYHYGIQMNVSRGGTMSEYLHPLLNELDVRFDEFGHEAKQDYFIDRWGTWDIANNDINCPEPVAPGALTSPLCISYDVYPLGPPYYLRVSASNRMEPGAWCQVETTVQSLQPYLVD